MGRPNRDFFARYTPDVAREMLGMMLVSNLNGVVLSGKIVETEAYRGADDPASHAYRGRTKRTAVMFGEAGHAYIYFTYGFHNCLNITTEEEGNPGAVLIRAVEPLRGIRTMRQRRGRSDVANLTNGPGKLTQAMGIDLSLNGEDVITSKKLYLLNGAPPTRTMSSPRIGVSVGRDVEWRFYAAESRFVSKL